MIHRAWSSNGGPRMLRVPTWQLALILVLALAIGIAIAVVATGVLLVALPVAALAAVAYRIFGKRRPQRGGDASVIEGDYEVIDSRAPAHPYRRDRR